MRKKSIDFKLYLITDRTLITHHSSLVTAVEEALEAGVRAVQFREKDLPVREQLDMAYSMKDLTTRYNAMLFINDRVDIALCVGAEGVHLGQSGIPVHAVRDMAGNKLMIGASTHSLEEASIAEEEGADFITFGPIYDTPSKVKYGRPVGIDALKEVNKKVSIPIFGIGGIKTDNIKDVIDAGAQGIALISGIFGEPDVRKATQEYLKVSGGS